jgi:hypothetical protein
VGPGRGKDTTGDETVSPIKEYDVGSNFDHRQRRRTLPRPESRGFGKGEQDFVAEIVLDVA